MRTQHMSKRRSLLTVVSLAIALAFLLSACGATAGAGSGSGSDSSGNTPTLTATSGGASGTPDGCPSSATVSSRAKPNVTVNLKNMNSTVTAHVADIIEVDLPFGQMWEGPASVPSNLTLQQPAGYAVQASKVCVWQFTAQNTGTAQLIFAGKAICKKGQACPQYVMQVPFTIEVK